LSEPASSQNRPKETNARLIKPHHQHEGSSPEEGYSSLIVALSPAIVVFAITLILSFGVGAAERLFLIQSKTHVFVRFLGVTIVLLAPLPILPPLMAFVGKRMTDEGFFGRLVKDDLGRNIKFSRFLLWVIRPMQGIGLSMTFSNQLLNLFRTYPEASFLGSLIRPILFVVISIPISLFFSTIWALDDLGVKLYHRKTNEPRLVGSYVGTVLPVMSGAVGIYSLFQRTSPTDALLLVTLIVMVLYPPYVVFAVLHHRFLSRRNAALFEEFLFKKVEIRVA